MVMNDKRGTWRNCSAGTAAKRWRMNGITAHMAIVYKVIQTSLNSLKKGNRIR